MHKRCGGWWCTEEGSAVRFTDALDMRFMQDTLDKWLEFQRNWMYLENIFGAEDIKRQALV
jgi:hypothetical protein